MLLILDASLIVSFLISDGESYARDIISLAHKNRVQLITTDEGFNELREALKASKIKKLTSYKPAKTGSFIAWYQYNAQFIPGAKDKRPSITSRDPKDNLYLILAEMSKADYLITVDKDLLVLKQVGQTQIVTPQTFIKKQKYV